MIEPVIGQGGPERSRPRRRAVGTADPAAFRRDAPVVPVVRLTGIIGFSTPLRPGLSLAGVARTLERAFAVRRAVAVALSINSPGGSAVQSHLIFRRIRELAEEHERHVIAFVEDAGASGGYMMACAADEIVADPELYRRLDRRRRRIVRLRQADRERSAVERRLYTVGRPQGDARSVPAGESRRCRTAEELAAGKSTRTSLRWSNRGAAPS